ncbi:hypothetical protein BDV41DRAFT_521156, partial [Aspergillus transmontanensis]
TRAHWIWGDRILIILMDCRLLTRLICGLSLWIRPLDCIMKRRISQDKSRARKGPPSRGRPQ